MIKEIEIGTEERVISLYEICKVMGKRHGESKSLAEEIQNKEGFGEVREIRTSNSNNVSIETYSYTKKQALMIGARLDSSNIIKLVNKLEELTNLSPAEQLLANAQQLVKNERELAALNTRQTKLFTIFSQSTIIYVNIV